MTSPSTTTIRALRGSVLDGGAAAVRRFRWERVRALLPEAYDEAWKVTVGVPGWLEERQAATLALAIEALGARGPGAVTIVEIGSYLGRSAVFQSRLLHALGRPGRVVAIDPHTGDRQQMARLGVDEVQTWTMFRHFVDLLDTGRRVEARRATSVEVGRDWSEPVDLLYVDGWHSYDAVREDGETWLHHLAEHGIVVFDDYAKYPEVRRAVDELAASGAFHPWGVHAGQCFGGVDPAPPAPLDALVAILSGRGARVLDTVRGRLTSS
jgi:predicted O-methyltransferase YrrM